MKDVWMVISLLVAFAVAAAIVLWPEERPSQDVPVLSVFCFQGYADREWVEAFEAQHHCRVKITYTHTIEEMFEKVRENPDRYNLVSIDSGRVELYERAGLLQPIAPSRLRNFAQLASYFREHPFSRSADGTLLHVPIVWGTQTVTINRDRVPAPVLRRHLRLGGKAVSLDILTDPALAGRVAFFDEAANAVAMAAMHEGVKDPHHFSAEDWRRVEARLRTWVDNAGAFTTGIDAEVNVLLGERVWVLLGGNDAILSLRLAEAGAAGKFAQYPVAEGTHAWVDGWVITRPTSGRVRDLAYAYIDYMTSVVGQRQLAQAVGFGPVRPEGTAGLPDVVRTRTYWYAHDIDQYPGPIHVMAPEEDPLRRVRLWERLKSETAARRN